VDCKKLAKSVNAVSTGAMGVNEAEMKTNNLVKKHRLGPDSLLGEIAEKKLATHIKKLQRSGFAPTREEVRVMAYNLAGKLGVKHNFDNVKGKLTYRVTDEKPLMLCLAYFLSDLNN
jgi:hypothetical protein